MELKISLHKKSRILFSVAYLLSGIFLVGSCGVFYYSGIWDETNSQNSGDIFPISVVLDVSQSMQVQDLNGDSRLDAAKKIIMKIGENNPGACMSLTVFAGDATKIMPCTSDREVFSTLLSGVDEHSVTLQWSDFFSGIELGLENFPKETDDGALILFSDGPEEKIDIPESLAALKKDIFIVGVGTQQWGNIPVGQDPFGRVIYKMYQWNTVLSRLEENNLQRLASQVQGKYLSWEVAGNIVFSERELRKDSENIFWYMLFLVFAAAAIALCIGIYIYENFLPRYEK